MASPSGNPGRPSPKWPNAGKSEAPLGGHSLRPLPKDPKHGTWKGPTAALSVVSHEPDGATNTDNFSIRSEKWRYTLCSNDEEELYDHAADPNEWTNLAKKPEYAKTKQELRTPLTKLVRASTGPVKSEPQTPGPVPGK